MTESESRPQTSFLALRLSPEVTATDETQQHGEQMSCYTGSVWFWLKVIDYFLQSVTLQHIIISNVSTTTC